MTALPACPIMYTESIMTADEIYAKSELDDDLMKEARAWREDNGAECDGYVKALLCGKPQKLRKASAIAKLAAVLAALPATYANYLKRGIPDKIFFDTFRDIAVWCENGFKQYGEKGLNNVKWLARHVSMRLFRLGRLQFEFSRFVVIPNAGLKNILKCPYRLGEKCIAVHIPQGEKLDYSGVLDSFGKADAFFTKFYPEYRYRAYNVVTWLLNPELEEVLGKESNIVRFGKLFTLLGRAPDNDMNERRVFGYEKDRASYAPRNALQAYTLNRINAGLPLWSYNGYRPRGAEVNRK